MQPDILLRDSLTQVYSRSSFSLRLSEEVNRSLRYGQTFSIVLLDIDYFKSINDAFGHARGDQILCELAQRITQIVRKTDIVFRYGGDEFVILLPNTESPKATNLGQRLLEQIRATPFPGTQPLTITISAGIASFPDDAQSAEALFEIADQRHYLAKAHGRNRLVIENTTSTRRSVIEEVPRLIERDQALTTLHHFLDTLPEQGRGVLRITALPECGSSRFLIETRKASNLRGYATLHLKGKPALKYRLNSVIYEALREALPTGLKEFQPGIFDPTNEKLLLGILQRWVEEKGKAGVLVTMDDLQSIDRSSLSAVRTLFFSNQFPTLGLVYADQGINQQRGFPFDISLQGAVTLTPLTPTGVTIWLRHSLQWEPPSEFVEWFHKQTEGFPGYIFKGIGLLLEEKILKTTEKGWEVAQNFSSLPLSSQLQKFSAQPYQNLPSMPTELVGRHDELNKLSRLLTEERLITIYGLGGVGKSRLALQAGAENLDRFPKGVYLISLETMSSADQLEYAIADTLGIKFTDSRQSRMQLIDYLQDKEILLILDDFDRVPGAAVGLAEILAQTPMTRCLVSSRSRTGIALEYPFELSGLPYPDDEKVPEFEAYSAVQLFLQSARRVQPDFIIHESDKADIARICKLVGGNALGIELAAALVKVVPCNEIVQQLEKNLAVFEADSPDNTSRLKSIQAILDSFWLLLSKPEQEVLCKLSVFEGSFKEEAGRKIADASIFFLDALSAKSMLQREPQGRYHLHELLRQHLFQKLSEIPREPAYTLTLHCRYYTEIVHEALDLLNQGKEKTAWEFITPDIINIRAAWKWAVENFQLVELGNSIEGLYRYYETKGQFQTGLETFFFAMHQLEQQCLQNPSRKAKIILGKVRAIMGKFFYHLGRYDQGIAQLQESINVFQQIDEGAETAFAKYELSNLVRAIGDYPRAIQLLEECLTYYKKCGDLRNIGDTLNSLGVIFSSMGYNLKSEHFYRESLAIFKTIGDQGKIARTLNNLGNLAAEDNRFVEAKQMLEESLAVSDQLGTNALRASILDSLGNVSRSMARYEESENYFQDALRLGLNLNAIPMVLESLVGLAELWACQGKNQQAYELLLEVRDHPATLHEVRQRAMDTLAVLGSQISSLPGPAKTENIENSVRAILYHV